MPRKRRRKFDLPSDLDIPGGLSTEEVDEAIAIFRGVKNKYPNEDNQKVWRSACAIVIASSEDFDEINGLNAYVKYYYKD